MPRNVLVVCPNPAPYLAHLRPRFPDVEFAAVAALECSKAHAELPAADAIIGYGREFDAECLRLAARLKWFQCVITGTDHLTPVLAGSEVVLTNARGIHGAQMAETAILHMMALSRNLPQIVRNQAAHVWDRIKPRVLDNRTVAILGVGAIAEHIARTCKALGMTTIGISRHPRELPGFDRMYPREDLRKAASEADFLLVVVPYSRETDRMVDAAVFAAMPPHACLINIARGGVVDETAMIQALTEKRIAGAGLDVFETSPLPAAHPLWDMENVFITPFIGGQSDQYERNALKIVEPNLRCFLAGDYAGMVNRVGT